MPMQSFDDDNSLAQISAIVDHITEHATESFSMAELTELGMSESRFSRYFRRATGNTFTDFVNRVRINRACQLLMETDRLRQQRLLRLRLQQRRQLQPALPRDQGHDAEGVPAPGRSPVRHGALKYASLFGLPHWWMESSVRLR